MFRLLLCFALFLCLAAPVRAENGKTYTHPEYGYSLTLPDGAYIVTSENYEALAKQNVFSEFTKEYLKKTAWLDGHLVLLKEGDGGFLFHLYAMSDLGSAAPNMDVYINNEIQEAALYRRPLKIKNVKTENASLRIVQLAYERPKSYNTVFSDGTRYFILIYETALGDMDAPALAAYQDIVKSLKIPEKPEESPSAD